ncbi:MAG: dockerin type I domain-containing protein [Oscillospiraceae bacterium]|nr:dockerin type I domain-containing protein [Oscillospiraceae bacterium]
MKKTVKIFTSVLTSALLAVSSLPVFSFAEEHITGDINCDGIVNSDDCFMILEYYAKKEMGKLDEISADDIEKIIKYGDLTGDGEVNSADASYIMANCMKFDLNGDGFINSDDTFMILDYYAKNMTGRLDEIPDEDIESILNFGDLNGDGEINSIDASILCNKILKTIDANGDGKIDIDDAMFFHNIAMNIDSYSEDEIKSFTKLTANIQYYYDTDTMKNAFMGYSSDMARTFSGLEMGDVNGDGTINASDASSVLSFYAEMSSGKTPQKDSEEYKYITLLGDIDKDGIVDSREASEILSIYAKTSSGQ